MCVYHHPKGVYHHRNAVYITTVILTVHKTVHIIKSAGLTHFPLDLTVYLCYTKEKPSRKET